MKIFKIALLAVISASLVGCASSKFRLIEKPITIGNKEYQAIYAERNNPWGGNAVTVSLVESDVTAQPQAQPQVQPQPMPQPSAQQQPAPQAQQLPVELPHANTRVINSNNQGSTGWVNGAFHGAVAGAFQGAGIGVAGALLRPSNVSASGGSGGQSSSSSSAASSAAASGR